MIDLRSEDESIRKSDGHHGYGEIRLGNGRENVKQYLRDDPAVREEIRRKILEKRDLPPPTASAADYGQVEESPAPAEPETPAKDSRRRAASSSESSRRQIALMSRRWNRPIRMCSSSIRSGSCYNRSIGPPISLLSSPEGRI